MTNTLVGDVYARIIADVVTASTNDFEESGISQATLQELQQEWQHKLSQRNIAQMPWDPKPAPQPSPATVAQQTSSHSTPNGLPSSSYATYDTPPPQQQQIHNGASGESRVKTEASVEANGAVNGLPVQAQPQGGFARAQQLVQQRYEQAAGALSQQQQRGGLALPGQQQRDAKPQGLQLPPQNNSQTQQQFLQQQQQAMQRQQYQMQQQQGTTGNAQIKVEDSGADLASYGQTDGASERNDDQDAMRQWQMMLEERRNVSPEHRQTADRLMRQMVQQSSSNLESGLMMPLSEHTKASKRQRRDGGLRATSENANTEHVATLAQFDGAGDDDDDEKPSIRDEDDEDAINSDLDDSDDEGQGQLGEDDDEYGDNILCTYDKVQRVKNKWKCTLKDGVMSVGGKEWVFHKGMGEFEW